MPEAAPALGSTPAADAQKALTVASAVPALTTSAVDGKKAPIAQPSNTAEMAHEMGHGGKDLPAMVRDMRNRFWICLIFTIPIFIYAPMGRFFEPPAPPFELE
ncbi:MAG: ATPase P, partial [Burkholderiaceae bacterium]